MERKTAVGNGIMQLANAGVLLVMDGCRILIDPFSVAYKGPLKNVFIPFVKTTAHQAWKMIYGEDLFRYVDLMLVSHGHFDHFSLPLTVKFLERHPETVFAADGNLVRKVRDAAGSIPAERFIALGEDPSGEDLFSVRNVTVRSWTTQHAGTGEYFHDVRHTTFRLDAGWSCVFLGDMEPSEENFERIRSAKRPDVAVVPYLYGILRKGERLLDSALSPAMVCYNHIPVAEGEAKAWRKAIYRRVGQLRDKGENRMILDQFGMMITSVDNRRKGEGIIGRKTSTE